MIDTKEIVPAAFQIQLWWPINRTVEYPKTLVKSTSDHAAIREEVANRLKNWPDASYELVATSAWQTYNVTLDNLKPEVLP